MPGTALNLAVLFGWKENVKHWRPSQFTLLYSLYQTPTMGIISPISSDPESAITLNCIRRIEPRPAGGIWEFRFISLKWENIQLLGLLNRCLIKEWAPCHQTYSSRSQKISLHLLKIRQNKLTGSVERRYTIFFFFLHVQRQLCNYRAQHDLKLEYFP